MSKVPPNSIGSGDGSNEEEEDYHDKENQRKPLPIDSDDDKDLFFENTSNSNNVSTSTDNKVEDLDRVPETDDEDSQFTFFIYYFLKFIDLVAELDLVADWTFAFAFKISHQNFLHENNFSFSFSRQELFFLNNG